MSRAMNIKMAHDQVLRRCQKAGVSVSTSEPLMDGGTHLVCTTSEGAVEMRRHFQDHIIRGSVQRYPFYHSHVPL